MLHTDVEKWKIWECCLSTGAEWCLRLWTWSTGRRFSLTSPSGPSGEFLTGDSTFTGSQILNCKISIQKNLFYLYSEFTASWVKRSGTKFDKVFDDVEKVWFLCRSPALGGGVLAIDRNFFQSVGAYDPGMVLWGAEQIELSIRVITSSSNDSTSSSCCSQWCTNWLQTVTVRGISEWPQKCCGLCVWFWLIDE